LKRKAFKKKANSFTKERFNLLLVHLLRLLGRHRRWRLGIVGIQRRDRSC